MAKPNRATLRWTPDEYKLLGANALQYLDKGLHVEDAFFKAQKQALSPVRHRSRDDLHRINIHSADKGGLQRFADEARAMHPAALVMIAQRMAEKPVAAPVPKAAPKPKAVAAPAPEPEAVIELVQKKRKVTIPFAPHITWTRLEECQLVAVVKDLQKTDPSKPLRQYFREAQEIAFPLARRKTRKAIDAMAGKQQLPSLLARGLSNARQFTQAQLEARPAPVEVAQATPDPVAVAVIPETVRESLAKPEPTGWRIAPKPFPERAKHSRVIWTTRQSAKVAREYDRMVKEFGPPPAITSGVYLAQQSALAPEYWKTQGSLYSSKTDDTLENWLKTGRDNMWLLKDDAPAPAVEVIAEVPDVAPEPAEPVAAVAASIPLPAPSQGLAAAAAAFGATLQTGLHLLLEAHAHHVLSTLDEKLASIAQAAGQSIGTQIAAQIERGLRQTVLDTMAAELGGPVKPPVPSDGPALTPYPPNPTPGPFDVQPQQGVAPSFPERPKEDPPPVSSAVNAWQAKQAAALLAVIKPESAPSVFEKVAENFTPKRLKVDVVGFTDGAHVAQVRKAFNGNTELMFYSADEKHRFKPHKGRYCVMLIDRIPHQLREKLTASKVKPILVKGTVYNVIHAIEELHRSKGIPQ